MHLLTIKKGCIDELFECCASKCIFSHKCGFGGMILQCDFQEHVVLEKTLAGLLDYKEIQLVHPKGDQSWVFIGRTDVEAETPILMAT